MHRRTFLATSAAAVTGPLVLGAADKAGSKTPTVGAGEHTYECVHGWGDLPAHLEWQTTHNVAVDAAGLVYICHQGTGKKLDTVVVFDAAGKFVRSFGAEWHGGSHGLDIRKEGGEEFVYLCNTGVNPKVVKTTLTGEVVWRKGRPETAEYADPKVPYSPTNVAFLPGGGFVVGDGYGANYLHEFDAAGKLVRQFGGTGTKPGQFKTPHGNWFDNRDPANPALVVCDRANARLQRFTPAGQFISATKPGEVLHPTHLDTRGGVMLVPDLHARVSLFGPKGELLAHLGDDAEWRKKVLDGYKVRRNPKDWVAGKFVHPHDACFDASGNIFVTEWVEGGRVTLLKRVG